MASTKHINMVGRRYNKILVLKRIPHTSPIRYWCKCDCGVEKEIDGYRIRNGNTKSCGCLFSESVSLANSTHGKSGSPEYYVWAAMKDRCSRQKNPEYKNYGGRGILVCEEWMSGFDNFYKDMGDRPSPSHTLERVNVNIGYCKGNCIWLHKKYQNWNRTNTVYVEFLGEKKPVPYWANLFDVPAPVIRQRLRVNKWVVDMRLFCVFGVGYKYKEEITNKDRDACFDYFNSVKEKYNKEIAQLSYLIDCVKNCNITIGNELQSKIDRLAGN